MKNAEHLFLRAAVIACLTLTAGAAELTTETFTAGLNGWTNGLDPTKWTASAQAARVSFAPNVLPQTASLEAGIGATGGAFTGDYRTATIEAIGFSLLAENILPSVLKIEITGGTNIYFQDLRPRMTPAGTTNKILLPLTPGTAAQWSGSPPAHLPDTLTNITRIAIRLTTAGAAAQSYRLDDIFLDLLPAATALQPTTTSTTAVTFTHLRTGYIYRVQATPDLTTPSWTNTTQLAATNHTQTITLTNIPPPHFLRLEN